MMRKILLLVLSSWMMTSCYTKHRFPIKTNPTGNIMDSLSGTLISEKSILITQDSAFFSEVAYAFFRNHLSDSLLTEVGSVSVNNDSLLFDQDHYEKLVAGMDTAANWNVTSGLSTIPSFNYSHVSPYPNYYIVPPDTIHMSQGISFPCMFVNTDSIDVYLGIDTLGKQYHMTMKPTDTALTLTHNQLASLNPSGASLTFSLHKFTTKTYNYKHFAFFKTYKINYGKTVFVP